MDSDIKIITVAQKKLKIFRYQSNKMFIGLVC